MIMTKNYTTGIRVDGKLEDFDHVHRAFGSRTHSNLGHSEHPMCSIQEGCPKELLVIKRVRVHD